MNFLHPSFLLLSAAAAVAVVLASVLVARARRRAIARFASAGLITRLGDTASPGRRAAKVALLSLGAALACVALARPRWGWQWREARRQGVDLLFAVDTSRSMLAEDVRPDRLTRAKLAVHDLVERFDGDRAGLIAFAGQAFLQSPMTLDRDAFGRALDALDTEVIPRPGTDVAAAIREARAAFGATDHERILVLLTDGEALEGDAVHEAEEAAREGVHIYTVGIGSAEGAPVPVRAADGSTTLLRGPDGALVQSRLDEATLRRIAAVTGGDYEPFGAAGDGLRRLYERRLSTLPRHAVAERRRRVWFERFQWPLGLAAGALALEVLLGDRRRAKAAARARRPATGLAMAALMAVALMASPALAVTGGAPVQTYNGGVRAYRGGNFAAAAAGFERALHASDLGLQERAYYDLGNARFRAGEATREHDRDATRTAWQASAHAYEAALRLQHDDADAQHNLDLVRRRLAELDQEQAQQQQQPQQQRGGQQGQQPGAQAQQPGAQAQQAGAQAQQAGAQAQQPGAQAQQAGAQAQQPGAHPLPTPASAADHEQAAGAGATGAPTGRLSARDAAALLDSMRHEERRWPLAERAPGATPDNPPTPTKDW